MCDVLIKEEKIRDVNVIKETSTVITGESEVYQSPRAWLSIATIACGRAVNRHIRT
jgi:hypothetical protein